MWWRGKIPSPAQEESGSYEDDQMIEELTKKLKNVCDEFAIAENYENIKELRFSNNSMDLFNNWEESYTDVFASRNKKTMDILIKDYNNIDYYIEKIDKTLNMIPDNPSYYGINPEHYNYSSGEEDIDEVDIYDLSQQLIDASLKNKTDQNAGLIYKNYAKTRIKTNYNDETYYNSGIEIVLRSFKGDYSGQEGLHYGIDAVKNIDPYKIGENAAETALNGNNKIDINEGKYDVLMSPYLIGTILTYNIGFLSYFDIDSGLSPFIGKLNENIASKNVNLYDDPLNKNGIGFTPVDEEGTMTEKLDLISNGTLKNYMHSYSTARKAGVKTTGNAGIISPSPWQIHMEKGNKDINDMISSMDSGLYINNSWYTRFQDERTGTFSTVPRDGVFLVKNGEIKGNVSGIRISDSILNILKNITEISNEENYVKWWDEIHSSIMPSVKAENINITKGF